jgi:hypothetical protein
MKEAILANPIQVAGITIPIPSWNITGWFFLIAAVLLVYFAQAEKVKTWVLAVTVLIGLMVSTTPAGIWLLGQISHLTGGKLG